MKKITVLGLIVLIVMGCTTTITTRMINQPISEDTIERQKLLDTIGFVLIENGFDIKMVNESFGIVNTEWRTVESGVDTALNILSILGSSSSTTTHSRAMMIQIQITENGYKLSPKLKRISRTRSAFGGSSDDRVDYPTKDSPEGKLAVKILEEINRLLGIENNYLWEEKVITIGEENQ